MADQIKWMITYFKVYKADLLCLWLWYKKLWLYHEFEFCHDSFHHERLALMGFVKTNSGTFFLVNKKIINNSVLRCLLCWLLGREKDTIWVCIWADFFPSIWLCTVQHCESALKWEPACYCTCSVPVMLSGAHFWVLFVVCQFLTVRDRSEAISLNLQFKLGPLQPDYKSTFRALRSSRQWMVDISNHSAVNPSVR